MGVASPGRGALSGFPIVVGSLLSESTTDILGKDGQRESALNLDAIAAACADATTSAAMDGEPVSPMNRNVVRFPYRVTLAWSCAVAMAVGTSAASAASITVAWDPNAESDVVGYVVSVGSRPGVADRVVDVGAVTQSQFTVSPGCVHVRVQAYNRSGLFSEYSNEVKASVGGSGYCEVGAPPPAPPPPPPSPPAPATPPGPVPPPSPAGSTSFGTAVQVARPLDLRLTGDVNGDGMDDGWAAAYGVNSASGDEDADGVTNAEEAKGGTDPTLPNVLTFAEGSTNGFVERIALLNPGPVEAVADVEFLLEKGARVVRRVTVPAYSRQSLMANSALGDVSGHGTTVRTLRGGLTAERTMWWAASDGGVPGHTGAAAPASSTQWYFAEGDAGFFDTYLLLANPQSSAASVVVRFLVQNDSAVERRYAIGANARLTVAPRNIPGLVGRAFGMHVASSVPIVAERAMYFGARGGASGGWPGGHETAGVTRLATSWFVAEGRTGALFDTYVLLGNPNAKSATATLRFLTPGGVAGSRTVTVPGYGRATVYLDEQPGLGESDVSVDVTSSSPIVVERAMYWPGTPSTWKEAHASTGVTVPGRRWVLAEGEVGGSLATEMFVLVANPGTVAAAVTVTFVDVQGRLYQTSATVAPGARATASSAAAALPAGTYGVIVDATAPVVAERSMYWPAGGPWRGGTNQVGQRVR